MSKTNICVIGLSKLFTDEVCKQLSTNLEMYYANLDEILEYELMDINKVEKFCGIEYLIKEEKSILSRVCSYENAVINVDYSIINNKSMLDIIKSNCLIVYLKLTKSKYESLQNFLNLRENEKSLNLDVFDDRDFICESVSDIVIHCEQNDTCDLINAICKEILNYYA